MATSYDHYRPPASKVGSDFVSMYYRMLQRKPEEIIKFYTDASTVVRVRGDFSYTTSDIGEIQTLTIRYIFNNNVTINTVNSCESWNGGVHLVVSGFVNNSTNFSRRMKFVQSFFLAPQEKGYIVLNDTLVLIGKKELDHNIDSHPNITKHVEDETASDCSLEEEARDYVESVNIGADSPVEEVKFQDHEHTPEAEYKAEEEARECVESVNIGADSPVEEYKSQDHEHTPEAAYKADEEARECLESLNIGADSPVEELKFQVHQHTLEAAYTAEEEARESVELVNIVADSPVKEVKVQNHEHTPEAEYKAEEERECVELVNVVADNPVEEYKSQDHEHKPEAEYKAEEERECVELVNVVADNPVEEYKSQDHEHKPEAEYKAEEERECVELVNVVADNPVEEYKSQDHEHKPEAEYKAEEVALECVELVNIVADNPVEEYKFQDEQHTPEAEYKVEEEASNCVESSLNIGADNPFEECKFQDPQHEPEADHKAEKEEAHLEEPVDLHPLVTEAAQEPRLPAIEEPASEPQKFTYASILRAPKGKPAPRLIIVQRPPKSKLPASDPHVQQSSPAELHESGETKSVCVKNLPPRATILDLFQEFKNFGKIKKDGVFLRHKKDIGICFAFVEFEDAQSVQNAVKASPIQVAGRRVYIEEKRPTTSGTSRGGRGRGGHFGGRGYGRNIESNRLASNGFSGE